MPAALDSGFTPATIVIDAPIEIDTPQGLWRPTNASNQFYGPTPVRTGIERSRNLMTIRLAQEIGMDVVGGYAERFGVYDGHRPFWPMPLAVRKPRCFGWLRPMPCSPMAASGVEPTLVDRVQDRYGRTIYRHDQRECVDCSEASLAQGRKPWISSTRARVMDEVTAYQANLYDGRRGAAWHRGQYHQPAGPDPRARPAPPMTRRDVWFVGYTSNIVGRVLSGL